MSENARHMRVPAIVSGRLRASVGSMETQQHDALAHHVLAPEGRIRRSSLLHGSVVVLLCAGAFGCRQDGAVSQAGPSGGTLVPVHELDATSRVDFVSPRALSARPGGFVVLDAATAQVATLDPALRMGETWGSRGQGPTELDEPIDLVVLGGDTVAILERGRPAVSFWVHDTLVERVPLPSGRAPYILAPAPTGGVCWPSPDHFAICLDTSGKATEHGVAPPVDDSRPFQLVSLLAFGESRWYRYENASGRLFALDEGEVTGVTLPESLVEALQLPPEALTIGPSGTISLGFGGVRDLRVGPDGTLFFALQHAAEDELIRWSPGHDRWHGYRDPQVEPGIVSLEWENDRLVLLRSASVRAYPMPNPGEGSR